MSQYGFLNFLYLFILIGLTVVNVNDIRNAIYNSVFIWLMLLIMRYYRHRMDMVIKCFTVAFTVCVWINFVHLVTHPLLWLVDDYKDATGYLFGNNYNQMGCRMMVALASNVLCLRYSRIWLINFIALAIVIIASLAMVGSMTSLSMILVFLVCCLLPTSKLRMTAICGLFVVFLLFQIFVVFNGRGLENNGLAVYIVEDVLKKDLTFTYRTHMWESALKIIEESPIWGWGFADADWFKANMSAFAIGPHNFILSILIHGGVILLSIYIMICSKVVKTIMPYLKIKNMQLLLLAVACLWVMSLFEMYPYTIMFYALALLYYSHYVYADADKSNLTTV
ncbi:O-antigen ligase family protein [Leyella stercorea]|uniref:O-antigen ligase family protein n=1 Tax=Leyella stercorea TaxID=363265 RepID=UPI0025EB99F3